mgnify:CR=1 FL=1|tara:strand:+ start:20214 stop:22445 length:2232 start_codon:yes stop_codon:yes gene_type:complete
MAVDIQDVIDLINQEITNNGNNEITGDVLRPVLLDILQSLNNNAGDLPDLNVNDKTNLVAAINELAFLISLGGGATFITFLQLLDTPNSYVGQQLKILQVNSAEDGLEFVDPTPSQLELFENEGDGNNWRVLGEKGPKLDFLYEGNIDVSLVDPRTINTFLYGMLGRFGFMSGGNQQVGGEYSTAMGGGNQILGDLLTSFSAGSFVWGFTNIINEYNYVCKTGGFLNIMGEAGNNGSNGISFYSSINGAYNNMPSGRGSHMFGAGLLGSSAYTTIVGAANVDETLTRSRNVSNDGGDLNPRFIVGIGDINTAGSGFNPIITRRNGFVVMNSGDARFPNLTDILIEAASAQSAVTKGWVLGKIPDAGSGLEAITEGNTGWRLIGRDPNNFGDIGDNAVDFSNSDSASNLNGSTGQYSATFGLNNPNNMKSTIMGGQNNLDISSLSVPGNFNLNVNNVISGASIQMGNSLISNAIFGERHIISEPNTNYFFQCTFTSFVSGGRNKLYGGHGSAHLGDMLLSGAPGLTVVGLANVDETVTVAQNQTNGIAGSNNPRFIVGCGTFSSYDPLVAGQASSDDSVLFRKNGFVVWGTGDAKFPLLTNPMIDSANDDSAVTKGWVENKVTVLRTKVSLTSAQLQTIDSVEIEAIPNPGVGKFIKIHSAIWSFVWGTTPFDAVTLRLSQTCDNYATCPFTLSRTSDRLREGDYNTNTNLCPNSNLTVSGNFDSVLTGDSTVDVYISYEIITL